MDIKTVYICPMCGRKMQSFVNGKIGYIYLEVVCSCGYNYASRGSARLEAFPSSLPQLQMQTETGSKDILTTS